MGHEGQARSSVEALPPALLDPDGEQARQLMAPRRKQAEMRNALAVSGCGAMNFSFMIARHWVLMPAPYRTLITGFLILTYSILHFGRGSREASQRYLAELVCTSLAPLRAPPGFAQNPCHHCAGGPNVAPYSRSSSTRCQLCYDSLEVRIRRRSGACVDRCLVAL